MPRSFQIVDYKVSQTEFFLENLQKSELNMFAAQCFTDAFVSSARSVTFALQSVCSTIPDFTAWYTNKQKVLRNDPLARFFKEYRDFSVHVGDTIIKGGQAYRDNSGNLNVAYYFGYIPELSNPPIQDVCIACHQYFISLLHLILDAYRTFPYYIDDRWYYTEENFKRLNKSIEDAEEDLGIPRGWTDVGDITFLPKRWKLIRSKHTVGCEINYLFKKYLGEYFLGPDDEF